MNNPWLGLSSYTEESIKEYQFNGRSTAIAALTTLIRQNLFVTLYGRSGIGKTSLLQAGVYPILRREGYSPLTIRLNELKDGKDNAAKNIWESITNSLFQNGYQYKLWDTCKSPWHGLAKQHLDPVHVKGKVSHPSELRSEPFQL